MQLSKLFGLSAALLLLSPAATYAQTAATGQREPGLYMTFQTEKGNISCKLFEKESPITVGKMVGLAIGKISYIDPRTKQPTQKKFFDGLTFHRVIPGFMIQGGDPLGTGTGGPEGPGFPYQNETSPGLTFNMPGRLAMANAGPNTNASQFFHHRGCLPFLERRIHDLGTVRQRGCRQSHHRRPARSKR